MAVVTMKYEWRIDSSPGSPSYQGQGEVMGNFDPDATDQEIREALEKKALKEVKRHGFENRVVKIDPGSIRR